MRRRYDFCIVSIAQNERIYPIILFPIELYDWRAVRKVFGDIFRKVFFYAMLDSCVEFNYQLYSLIISLGR